MNKTTILFATAALCVSTATAWAGEQVKVVEHPINETTVDIGAKGDSVGDLLTFANPVFNAANTTQIGSDQGYCVRVVVGKSWECIWTILLKSGHITVEGPFFDEGDSVFAITGGTGKYSGAKGSMKLHPRDATPTGYDFTYTLK
jgi:allene oxide cyclase